jgi:uncharacterized hydrophobic protein (TIGR00271 family)
MMSGLVAAVLPDNQRRTLVELTEDLDLTSGDRRAKTSAFWIMLVLSGVIATAGVMADSTATVIGAMIIAPLSTPIMGIALGVAKAEGRASWHAGRFVLGGVIIVVATGALVALVLPASFNPLANTQITGRVSPGLFDLMAAVATGFAGAIALSRRDVAAVLPGVAIAISLVPPLAVVGVCLGVGSWSLAMGALVLFLSNLLALVLAGTVVFAFLGYGSDRSTRPSRKARLTVGLLFVIVAIPLVVNTVSAVILSYLTERVQDAAEKWAAETPGVIITEVDIETPNVVVEVQAPGDIPPVADLVALLNDELPSGVPVIVKTSVGERIDAGTTG